MQNMQFRNLGNRFLWRVRNSGNHKAGHVDAHGLFFMQRKTATFVGWLFFSFFSFPLDSTARIPWVP